MAGVFDRFDDEDNVLVSKEPQVTSQDPDERKAARALRIKRRQDALKRADQPSEEVIAEEEPGLIEQATASAAQTIQRLSLEGTAKVTNVKVTTDEREVIRRGLFAENMRNLLEQIEEEAAEAQTQYEIITSNWEKMLTIKDPLDIDAEIGEQKRKCDALLNQKNVVIAELKNQLKHMDEAYDRDLDKQDKDIKELSDRIEKQVTILQRACEKQLIVIEHAINLEREAMVEHNNKRWEALYKQRDKEELAHIDYKFEQLEEYKQEIETIMWDHHEKYREAKIELETLIQELQKELEKLKATCVINTEKIGYNYQILKKREEENVFVRSQQKRKLNKMSDIANALRTKIRKAAEEGAIEEIKADAEIVKLMQTMADLEKKSNQFKHVNNYKFSQIWRMAAYRCAELSNELRQGEVALHAHILAEPPPLPPPPPPKSPLSKYEREEVAKSAKNTELAEKEPPVCPDVKAVEAKNHLVSHILQLVADNTGFLVENRLFKLIDKYQPTSRNLCTLDAIFMALEIQAEEDIELLCKTFLNYAFCPICVGSEMVSEVVELSNDSQDESHQATVSVKSTRGDRTSIRGRGSVARSVSASTSRSAHTAFRSHELSPADQVMMAEADEILQKYGETAAMSTLIVGAASDAGGSASVRRPGTRGVTVSSQPHAAPKKSLHSVLCPFGHPLEIEPMQVLTALGEFIKIFVPPEKKKLYDILDSVKPPDFSTPSRRLQSQEIDLYWTQWKTVFPSEKDRFWDGLLTGLNSYLNILQERERLHEEVEQLRHRNAALRRLVHGALPKLTAQPPKYSRSAPGGFTATVPDLAPLPFARLPPI